MGARSHEDEREWIGLTEAGHYANVNPDVLKRAIIAGELEAHEKPLTYGRKQGARQQRAQVRVSKSDIDRYIREHWRRADASTFGLPDAVAEIGKVRCA